MIEDITQFLNASIFPMVVALYLIIRMEQTIRNLTKAQYEMVNAIESLKIMLKEVKK